MQAIDVRRIEQRAKSDPQNEIKRLFGMAVRDKRKRIGISQEELALRARLNRTYICNIECGKRNVSLVNIYKLALAMRILPTEFFTFVSSTATVLPPAR